MIQGIVGRMSANSAALKGFCITGTAAILAVQGEALGVRALWLLVLVALFAMCDAGYLRMERDFRRLWITRINAAARINGTSYSRLVSGLKKAAIGLDRKVLSEIAIHDAPSFAAVARLAATAK